MVAEFYYVEFSNVTDENDRNLDGFLINNTSVKFTDNLKI